MMLVMSRFSEPSKIGSTQVKAQALLPGRFMRVKSLEVAEVAYARLHQQLQAQLLREGHGLLWLELSELHVLHNEGRMAERLILDDQ